MTHEEMHALADRLVAELKSYPQASEEARGAMERDAFALALVGLTSIAYSLKRCAAALEVLAGTVQP